MDNRTGMEDNIWLSHEDVARSNGELAEKAVQFATGVGREIATPEEARKILGGLGVRLLEFLPRPVHR